MRSFKSCLLHRELHLAMPCSLSVADVAAHQLHSGVRAAYAHQHAPPVPTPLFDCHTDHGTAVLVELKARFDEARNVGFATTLEEAGCNVAYGIVGLKTHAKCMLIVRRERSTPHGLRTYVHIGTGNYNPSTASTYTDLGLLSCDPQLGEDVVDLFKYLTGIHLQKAVGGFRRLLVGNQYMKGQLLALIDKEIAAARRGEYAGLCIKVRCTRGFALSSAMTAICPLPQERCNESLCTAGGGCLC